MQRYTGGNWHTPGSIEWHRQEALEDQARQTAHESQWTPSDGHGTGASRATGRFGFLEGVSLILGVAAVLFVVDQGIGTHWPWYGMFAWMAIFLAPGTALKLALFGGMWLLQRFVVVRIAAVLAFACGILLLIRQPWLDAPASQDATTRPPAQAIAATPVAQLVPTAARVAVAVSSAGDTQGGMPTTGTGFVGHDLQLEEVKGTQHLAGPYHLTVSSQSAFANLAIWVTQVRIPVTDNTIAFDFSAINEPRPGPYAPGPFNGYIFTTSPGTPTISGVSIDASETNMPVDTSRLRVSGDVIRVDFQGLSYSARSSLKLNVAFSR